MVSSDAGTSVSSMIDHNHPLYLQPSDSPSVIQTGIVLTAYALILQDESQKLVAGRAYNSNEHMEPTALFTAMNGLQKQRKSSGHLKENCYKIIGYPDDFKGKNKANAVGGNWSSGESTIPQHAGNRPQAQAPNFTQEHYQQILNMLSKSPMTEHSANMVGMVSSINEADLKWIVDTGTTNHIISDKNTLCNGTMVENSENVQLPNGEVAAITQIENYQLTRGDLLENVLCVLAFKFNLLSVSKLTKSLNYYATFFPDFFIFQDLFTRKVKEIGREEEGLYVLHSRRKRSVQVSKRSMAVTETIEADTWHKRMGHVHMSILRKITKFRNKVSFNIEHFDGCPIARQTRMPFPTSDNKSIETFNLLHMDIWSPYKVPTYNRIRDKFGPRAAKAVLLGYLPTQKGYKLYDIDNRTTFVSRDVVFYESIFPFNLVSQKDLPSLPQQVHYDWEFPSFDDLQHQGEIESTQQQNPPSSPIHISPGDVAPYQEVQEDAGNNSHGENATSLVEIMHVMEVIASEMIQTLTAFIVVTTHALTTLRKSERTSKPLIWLKDFVSLDKGKATTSNCLWVKAMKAEIQALEDNNTLAVVPFPNSKKAIGFKWVYKIKCKATAINDWCIYQMDVFNAFLHEDLHEKVYMQLPQGISHPSDKHLPAD
uniref:Reverse transcriptase Ty1/copia-type domain-containing protein n=1 Tax=Nicotiana tabacum TaxID=4097 RepID=A0A1S3Z3C7_TOBAC|nr:PREDICTED: uncharacterized protein LOC107782316 [Nicotiana tabacum]